MRSEYHSKLCLIGAFFFMGGCAVTPTVQPEPEVQALNDAKTQPQQVNTKALTHFMEGELHLSQGNYAMAILEFQDALKYDPGATSILTSLADAYLRIGKTERAMEQLNQALMLDPKDREAREMVAHQFLMRNNLDRAEEHYSLLSEFYPENHEYRFILAEVLRRKGESEKAQDLLWQIYRDDSSQLQALSRASGIALERKDYESAFEGYRILTEAEPNSAQFWRKFSELAIYLQRFSLAIGGLERLIDLTNDDPSVLEQLGRLYFDSSDFNKADSVFFRLFEDGHQTSTVLYFLGRMALDSEDYEAAEAYSLQLTEQFPQEPAGYTNLALARINLDKTLASISVLMDARERFPESFAVHYLLGNSYSMEENYQLAKKSLLSALNIDEESRPAKHLLATVHNHLGEWQSSLQLYEDLLLLDENDSQALNNYSYTLAERDMRLNDALEMALKAIELEPENPAFLDTIGWIYYKRNKYEKALHYIEASIRTESENAVVLEHLGDVLIKMDRRVDAMDYYGRALEIDSDNERLLEKIER